MKISNGTKSKLVDASLALCNSIESHGSVHHELIGNTHFITILNNDRINLQHWVRCIEKYGEDCCLVGHDSGAENVIKLLNSMDEGVRSFIFGGRGCFELTCNKQNCITHIMRRKDSVPMIDLFRLSFIGRLLSLRCGIWNDESKVIIFNDGYKVVTPDMACAMLPSTMIKVGMHIMDTNLEHHPVQYMHDAQSYL